MKPSTSRLVMAAAAAAALLLSSCGSGQGTEGRDDGPCSVVYLASADRPTAEQDAYRQVMERFGEEYNCTVEVKFEGSWDEIVQQVTSARIAQEQLDVVSTSTSTRDLADAGMLTDLTACVAGFSDRYQENALSSYNYGDRQYAVPNSSFDTSAIIYNKTMFESLGIAAPTTYEELVAAGRLIKQQGVTPIIHQGKSPWYWSMWFMAAFGESSGDQSIEYTEAFLRGERRFDSPEEIAALEALSKFTADGLIDRASLDTDQEGMRAAFLQQRAAMFFGLTPELVNLRLANPPFEIGVLQFPLTGTSPGAHQEVGGGPKDALAITSFASEQSKQAACQLLEFMSRPDNADIVVGSQDPMISSVTSVAPTTDEPLADQLNAEFMPNTVTYLDWIWPGQVNDAVRNAILDVMYNGVSAGQAAANVQAAYDKLVAEEGYQYNWWDQKPEGFWQEVSFQEEPAPEVK